MNTADQSTLFTLMYPRPAARRRSTSARVRRHAHAQWFRPLKQFKEIVSGWALMSAGSACKSAQAVPARLPFSASLGVMPTIAAVNTPRLLTITAFFPLGRGPTAATVATVVAGETKTLEVRLDMPSPDFAFCDLALVPYTVEVAYTPSEAGDLPVRMMTSDGVAVGESVVMTRGGKRDDAQFDVTGKWIDPATSETGLAFTSDSPAKDSVVGTWNFSDYQGVSHRYSIEGVHWNMPDVEAEGAIFETTPCSTIAPSPDMASATQMVANQVGLARIMFNGFDSARIFALGFGGNVLFTSNLVRSAT
jgi:hypothetical protein